MFLDLYPKTVCHGVVISMHPRVERLSPWISYVPLRPILNLSIFTGMGPPLFTSIPPLGSTGVISELC